MVESRLHLALKNAVKRHHAQGSRCWYESNMQPWGGNGSQRADVQYYQNCRNYYVECETRPNINRLRDKGRRRNRYKKRGVYNLVIPESEYTRCDWRQLRGFFDKVYAYSVEEDRFTESLDLRALGFLQDLVLNLVTPLFMSPLFQGFYRPLWRRKNWVAVRLWKLGICVRCCMGGDMVNYYCWVEDCRMYRFLQKDKAPPE